MKTIVFLVSLMLSKYCCSQVSAYFDGVDAMDTYMGARNLQMSVNQVRAKNLFDCTDTMLGTQPVIERVVFNKYGEIDSLIKGKDILNNSISLIQAFTITFKNRDTVLTCINKYISPGKQLDSYDYSYLYSTTGMKSVLKYPTDENGNLVLIARYNFKENGTVEKKVYDAKNRLILDTILTRVKYWDTKHIMQKGWVKTSRLDVINGKKTMSHVSYFNGRPTEDSLYVIDKDGKTFVKRKVFFYNNDGKLIRESILDNTNILLSEKRISYEDGKSDRSSYEEEDFSDGSISVYNFDGQMREITYGSNPRQIRRYSWKYSEKGLLLEKSFSYKGKTTSRLCAAYEYFGN